MLKYKVTINFEVDDDLYSEDECDEITDMVYSALHECVNYYDQEVENIDTELILII